MFDERKRTIVQTPLKTVMCSVILPVFRNSSLWDFRAKICNGSRFGRVGRHDYLSPREVADRKLARRIGQTGFPWSGRWVLSNEGVGTRLQFLGRFKGIQSLKSLLQTDRVEAWQGINLLEELLLIICRLRRVSNYVELSYQRRHVIITVH